MNFMVRKNNFLICTLIKQQMFMESSTCISIWATSWENLFLPYANNKGADQPAHPHSLISAFVIRCLDSIIPLVSISEISSLYLASVAVQAGLSLPWSQTPEDRFSSDVAHLKLYHNDPKYWDQHAWANTDHILLFGFWPVKISARQDYFTHFKPSQI